MAKKKLAKWKAEEMLHNPPHGKKLTDKQRKYFGAVAYGQDGLSILNPKNWGVADLTKEGSFNKAFERAKKANAENFIWNGNRYNTKSNLTPEQQLSKYGIIDEQRLPQTGLKGRIRHKLADNLNPFGYEDISEDDITDPLNRVFNAAILNRTEDNRVDNEIDSEFYPDQASSKAFKDRVDYNNLYFGKPQKYNTKKLSEYKPKKAKDKSSIYYTSDHVKKALEIAASNPDRYFNETSDKENRLLPLMRAGNTNRFKLDRGKDEKGEYISYYDIWDLTPSVEGGGGEDESIGLGKPFEIYDRIYLPKDEKSEMKNGGKVIKDNRGQWAHPGKVTQIDSNNITMKGINYPVLGVSNTGDTQMMYPNQDYNFKGKTVTEFPMIAKSGIHIDPKNRGKFNALKKKTGKSTEELTHSDNPLTRKRAIFAQNAAKWNKGQSGVNLSQNQTLEMMKPFAQDDLEELQLKNALQKERQQKRDSIRSTLSKQFQRNNDISRGMTDYYKTEPPEYLDLDINLLNQSRRDQLLKTYNTKFEYGGKTIKKAQYGYTEPTMEEYYPEGTGFSNPNGSGQVPIDVMGQPQKQSLYNRIGGNIGTVQGINAVNYEINAPSGENGPSTAQKTVGQFGPWGQAISQVSQMGTRYFNNASNTYANNYASSIFDPAATFENKDLSSTDRLLGGLSPTYGAYVKKKARKQKQEKEDRLKSVVDQAANSQDINANKRRYVRPEDQLIDPNQMSPTYGTGTNYLKQGGNVPNMEKGGELQTYWGGEAEQLSENPYLPGGGETIMFKGNSHAEGGIGMKFGGSSIEVEGGEPAVKLNEGNKESLTVFGDMKIPSYGVSELNDPKAKGKKFKNYINDLSKLENKQNKVVEKGVKLVNDTPATDSFDKLKISSGKAMMEGGNMRLKQIADKKQIAANVQNAILETAEEMGLKSAELAKGKFKKAKMGKKIEYAQDGGRYTIPRYQMDEYQAYGYIPDPNDPDRMYRDLTSNGSTSSVPVTPPGKGSEEFNRAFGDARKQKLPEFSFKGKNYTTDMFQGRTKTITNPGSTSRDYIYLQDDTPMMDYNLAQGVDEITPESAATEAVQQKERADWLPIVNSIIPFIRPSNARKLDQNQLLGEMNAMATNQLEPVQAQLYNPLLENVSDISLQDQLNANQADFNAIQRYTAQNPAAQATLAAQKYQANSSVLGEQFRQNQGQKMGVYNRNRGTLNDATLKNLAILDQQYVRQSQAKSNTKAVAQAAINSISDKIARNKLENRTLGVYENLYNYRFDNSGRAWNMNPLAQFVIDQGAVKVDSNGKVVMDETKVKRDRNGMIINSTDTSRVTQDTNKKRNGGIVKAIKAL